MLPWLEPSYQQLSSLHQRLQLPHALLLSGRRGLGKQQLAEAVVRLLLCQAGGAEAPCGRCKSCQLQQAGHHPDFWQDTDASERIGVDSIRQLSRFFHEHAQQGGARVAVLERVERMSEAAANALLKTLEEPPAGGYLILTSDQPALLLPTIVSRCQQWSLTVADTRVVDLWWQQQGGQTLDKFFEPLLHSAPLEAWQWQQSGQLEQVRQSLLHLEQYLQGQASMQQTVQLLAKTEQLPLVLSWFVRERLAQKPHGQPQGYWQFLQRFQQWCRDEQQLLGQNKQLALTALLIELKRLNA
ncbi:MAG: DNA polymerase III subunit delta' [Alkalimonas sp.]|nr:DNA polymerase III subunit delta' [Alkalimonas sp.]